MRAYSTRLLAGLGLLVLESLATASPPGSPWGANYFPNVPLITQDGETVHFYDDVIKDKIVVINFIYASCADACPLETAKLVQVQKQLGDRVGRDIFMYSISIDPERDTPTALKEYAARYRVGPGWTFLTGTQADIDTIRKSFGLYAAERQDHAGNMMVGNDAVGQWIRHGIFDDTKFMARIIGDWLDPNWKYRMVARATENPQFTEPTRGESLFKTRCSACHTFGAGSATGPDLLGVTTRRDREWLRRWIATPDRMLAARDPIALALFAAYNQIRMPNLRLSRKDVDELIELMEDRDKAGRAVTTAAEPTAPSMPASASP